MTLFSVVQQWGRAVCRVLAAPVALGTAVVALSAPALAQWRYEGLDNRFIYALHRHGDTLYAATDNGVYTKILRAAHDADWVPVGLQGTWVRALTVTAGGALIAARPLTPEDTAMVLRSDDGGATWQSIRSDSMQYAQVLYRPAVGDSLLFATTEAAVVRSNDGGATWHSVWGSWEQMGYGVHFVRQDPAQPSVLWSGGESGIFQPYVLKSTDAGLSWERMQLTAGGDNAVYSAAVMPGVSSTVLLGMEGRIMRTTDGGATWTTVFEPPGGHYVFGLEFSPENTSTVYASGMRNTTDAQPLVLYRSDDGGVTWQTATYDGASFEGRSTLSLLLVQQSGADVLYFGTHDGVYSYAALPTDVDDRFPVAAALTIAPNPVCEHAVVSLVLPQQGRCDIVLTTAQGQVVRRIVQEVLPEGAHEVAVPVSDLPSGVYLLHLATAGERLVRHVVVVH